MTDEQRLRQLHERIADLESGGALRGPRTISAWTIALALALAAGAGRLAALRAAPTPIAHVEYGPPRYDKPAPGALQLALPAGMFVKEGPVLLDLNGDGARDLVLRCWHRGLGQTKLFVVALDRKTLAPLWKSDAFPGLPDERGGQLAGQGSSLVLSDGTSTLHVLDASTGVTRGSRKVQGDVTVLRAMDEGMPQLVVVTSVPSRRGGADEAFTLDLASIELRKSPLDVSLQERWCATDFTRPCEPYGGDRAVAALQPFTGHIFYATHQLRAVDQARPEAGVWHYPTGGREWREHALVWNGKRPAWRGPLAGAEQPWPADTLEHDQKGMLATDADAIYYVYPAIKGDYRLTARTLATGALRYDVAIEGLQGDEAVDSLAVDGDTLFLVNRSDLYVLDTATGVVRRVIDAI